MTEDKPLSMDFHSVGFIPRLPPHTKNSDGDRHRSFHVPHAARPRRLCQPPWTQLSLSETRQLSGGSAYEETHPPNASRSSGEGVWGRGASLREAASPPESPPPSPHLSGREREGGGLSSERPPPSQYLSIHYFPAAVNVPTSTEEEPTPLAGKIKSLPMARMFLSTS